MEFVRENDPEIEPDQPEPTREELEAELTKLKSSRAAQEEDVRAAMNTLSDKIDDLEKLDNKIQASVGQLDSRRED